VAKINYGNKRVFGEVDVTAFTEVRIKLDQMAKLVVGLNAIKSCQSRTGSWVLFVREIKVLELRF